MMKWKIAGNEASLEQVGRVNVYGKVGVEQGLVRFSGLVLAKIVKMVTRSQKCFLEKRIIVGWQKMFGGWCDECWSMGLGEMGR